MVLTYCHLANAFLLVHGNVEGPHGETEKTCFYNNASSPVANQSRNGALLNQPTLNIPHGTASYYITRELKPLCPCLEAVKTFDLLYWPGEDHRGCVYSPRSASGKSAGVAGPDSTFHFGLTSILPGIVDFHKGGWGHMYVCVHCHCERLSVHVHEQFLWLILDCPAVAIEL